MNQIKKSRSLSFVVVAVIYALAGAVGIGVYLWLPWPFWLSLLGADAAATVFTFILSCVFRNASVYDPYWSVQPIVILAGFAIARGADLLGALTLTVVCLWGLRLTANWAYTFHGLDHQDWRYTMLCEKTGAAYPLINFIGIHMVPTLVVYGCTLPGVFLLEYGGRMNVWSVLCLLVSVCAFTLQGIADVEMHRFHKGKAAGERTEVFIRDGLWKNARHPNYLGEIAMWWGVGGAAVCAMPERWWLLAGALANTILFLAVSIPMAEGKQGKKPGYGAYRKATRALFPIPRGTR